MDSDVVIAVLLQQVDPRKGEWVIKKCPPFSTCWLRRKPCRGNQTRRDQH
jgi:hypothetical protein